MAPPSMTLHGEGMALTVVLENGSPGYQSPSSPSSPPDGQRPSSWGPHSLEESWDEDAASQEWAVFVLETDVGEDDEDLVWESASPQLTNGSTRSPLQNSSEQIKTLRRYASEQSDLHDARRAPGQEKPTDIARSASVVTKSYSVTLPRDPPRPRLPSSLPPASPLPSCDAPAAAQELDGRAAACARLLIRLVQGIAAPVRGHWPFVVRLPEAARHPPEQNRQRWPQGVADRTQRVSLPCPLCRCVYLYAADEAGDAWV